MTTIQAVIHHNPGLIDPVAFTTFGVNSKPATSSPIGYFGTGLKYAIAVLCRHKCPLTLWIGQEPYVFEARATKFRDKDFLQIYMKRQRGATARWMAQALPFTTELGKNWDLWMAYRELHANALDEQGTTSEGSADGLSYHREWDHKNNFLNAKELTSFDTAQTTRFVVGGEAYAEVHSKRHEIFLPPSDANETGSVRYRNGRSEYAYYRGLRALKLSAPSIYTWDFHCHMDLTEDRTIKHSFMVPYYIAEHVLSSTDKDFIKSILTAPTGTLEHAIDWDSQSTPASPEFIEMARRYIHRNTVQIIERDNKANCKGLSANWKDELSQAIRDGLNDKIISIIEEHRYEIISLLKTE